jgi:hypothetical protein
MQVMPAVINVMKEEASLITLVKPQFEARRSQVRNSCSYVYIFNLSGARPIGFYSLQ